ncbi:EVE domain-containing protein [Psychromarinibacter sp. C21-152]|uniref:EVE domain-containing protein n=1 Tax=Psychromarinibacter sediminicola TaxID=3033385 RepID=A0AAE3TA95_9RHOB|nr:EVE domain-containing protein [Psychromarinibacter sediminicola]MDF0601764.1 EVE domain-containing protein [Psychromarinibacter sediminicola]
MRYFVGVVHRRQAAMARAAGIVAFSHGRAAPVKSLAPGDRVVFYAPKTDFDGDPVQAFVAHARVTGDAPRERDFATGMTGWCRDAAFDEVTAAPVRPLLDHLSFVKNPRHWGMAFRQGKFEISGSDYRLIADALGVDA